MSRYKLKYKSISGGLLVSLLFLFGCLDQIDLKIPKGFEETFVIQGVLVKGNPSIFDLNVSRLFDFTPESRGRVNVSQVILEDDAGNSTEIERTGTGIYKRTFPEGNPDLAIELGRQYKVSIRTFDGRTFESTFEPLLGVPLVDSLAFQDISKELIIQDEETKQDSVVRFSVNTPLTAPNSAENVGLKWDVRRVFQLSDSPIEFGVVQKTCYITEAVDITTIKVFNGYDFNGTEISDITLYDQDMDFHFAEGYYLEVVQSALSRGAFEYWDQISNVLERDGNMFEAPAGKIASNFINPDNPEDTPFGYFYATQNDTARVYVPPSVARFPNKRCPPTEPPPPGGGCAVEVCCDCLSAEISTSIKPAFWKE